MSKPRYWATAAPPPWWHSMATGLKPEQMRALLEGFER